MNNFFKFCHRLQLQTNLLKPRFDLSLQFVRDSGNTRRKLPYPTKKFSPWLTKQHKVKHDELLTKENKDFIQEVIKDKFPQASPLGAPGSPLKDKVIEPATNVEWDPKLKRTGVLAKKIGVVPLWMKDGTKVLSTMLQVIDNHVIKYIPPEQYNPMITKKKDYEVQKYGCMIVGAQGCDPQKFTKEYCGLFSEAGVMPKRRLARFQISPEAALQPGTPLVAAHFRPGEYVDVKGKTMNRGFHGVMKRWGFAGMPATHGVTKTHRRPGCIGHGAGKGNVLPGKKMPGHMGNRHRFNRGLRILRINTKYNVIWTLGQSIPGSTNSYVYIYDTLLKEKRKEHTRSFPTFISKPDEILPDDLWAEDVHQWGDPTIEYKPDN